MAAILWDVIAVTIIGSILDLITEVAILALICIQVIPLQMILLYGAGLNR